MAKVSDLSAIQVNPNAAPAEKYDFWGSLGAGGYSALNSALMGLPDLLVKTAGGSEAYKKLKEYQKTNAGGTAAGDVVGTLGSLLIPGGAIVKGLGAGAKGLGAVKAGEGLTKAGEFLGSSAQAGDKFGKLALKGAGQALEQAVPRSATQVLTGEETVPEAAGGTLLSGVLGAGLGGVLGKGAQFLTKGSAAGKAGDEAGDTGIEFLKGEAREKANQMLLASRGIQTGPLKRAVKLSGLTGAKAGKYGEDYLDDIASVVKEKNIRGKRDWDTLSDENKGMWQQIDDGFQANAPDTWAQPFAKAIVKDPDISGIIKAAPSTQRGMLEKGLADIALDIQANAKDISTSRQQLGNLISTGFRQGATPDEALLGQVASQIKNRLDDEIGVLSGVGPEAVAEAKRVYKALQPFYLQEGKDIFTLTSPLGEMGSPTFEKQAGALLTGGLLGGGTVGLDALSGEPIDMGKAGLAALAGLAGPRILGAARNAINKTGASALSSALDSPAALKAAELAGKAADPLAAGVPRAVPGLQEAAEDLTASQMPEEVPAEVAPVEPLPTDGIAPTVADGAVAPPDLPPPPAYTQNPQFQSVLTPKLRQIYLTAYADMPEADFMAAVARKTNNFNDMDQVAKILFPGDNEQKNSFLTQYRNYQTVKNIDINRAVEAGGLLAGLPGTPFKEQAEQLEQLEAVAMANASGGEPSKVTTALQKQWANDIAQLRNSRGVGIGPREVSPALLSAFAQKWGLDFKNLADLGVKE